MAAPTGGYNMSACTLRLYEIADTYLHALEDLAGIEDLPPEVITDTMEGLAGTFEQKALHTAAYIRTLEAEAHAIAEACKRMEQRQKALERHAARLKDYLKLHMERTGMTRLKNSYLALRVSVNPPSVVVDEAQLPERYKQRIVTVKVLKAELAQALKAGSEIPGARLEQSTRLVIS